MTDQSQITVAQGEPVDETPDLSPAPPGAKPVNVPALEPLVAEETSWWDTAVQYMAYAGLISILGSLVYIAIVFNRVNQWDSVTESLANGAVQIRISYPRHVGRDETNKLHVVVENKGQETFTNLRVGFTSNGIARFRDSEAIFASLPANAQRNATLEYTIDNAELVRGSNMQLTAHLYYITDTLSISSPTATLPLQSAQLNEPITILVNPDREYYLRFEAFWGDLSTKLPAIIISIISAIGAFVSINVQGGPAKILQWLVQAPRAGNSAGKPET